MTHRYHKLQTTSSFSTFSKFTPALLLPPSTYLLALDVVGEILEASFCSNSQKLLDTPDLELCPSEESSVHFTTSTGWQTLRGAASFLLPISGSTSCQIILEEAERPSFLAQCPLPPTPCSHPCMTCGQAFCFVAIQLLVSLVFAYCQGPWVSSSLPDALTLGSLHAHP